MTDDCDDIFDPNDNIIRKLGLLLPDPTYVCSFPVYEDLVPSYSDSDVKDLLTDPNRVKSRTLFDDHWVVQGNQQQHGSCNGWAGASSLSKARFFSGIKDGLVLSGSYVYSWINNGQDNGSALDRGMAELMAHGAPPASLCDANQIYRNQTSQFDSQAVLHEGLQCYAVKTQAGFNTAVARQDPVVVAVQVGNAFMNYKTGLIPVVKGPGNHACHVDDARVDTNGTIIYDFVNNWGLSWGTRGRGECTWNIFAQPFGVHQFYAIPAVRES